ncbi:nitroreductase [candidate division KSB1 bacterium]|nr:nitroreductase [candidate division KSB1 bacterium]
MHPLSRRHFIHHTALGLAGVATLSTAVRCGGTTRNTPHSKNPDSALAHLLSADLQTVLRDASLAPSSHNTQPWRIRIIEPLIWELEIDPSRRLPQVDPLNIELRLSLGAFIGNLRLSAAAHGYQTEIETRTDGEEKTIIRLHSDRAQAVSLDDLRLRRTIRKGLQDKEIAAADLDFLQKIAPEAIRFFPRRSPRGESLAQMTIEAFRAQSYRDPAQEELADWIRWSSREAESRRDGLTPASMDITGMAGWFVRTFYNRDSVLSSKFREQGVKMVIEQVENCGGWIVLEAENPALSTATLLQTGEHFLRLTLAARSRLIAVHPMSQTLEETPWKNEVAAQLGLQQRPAMILRVGYVDRYPRPVSLRRPPAEFCTTAG